MKHTFAESLEQPLKSEEIESYDEVSERGLLKPVVFHELRESSGFYARSAGVPLMARRELFHGLVAQTHQHSDFWALFIARHGRAVHRINDRDFDMTRGSVYLMQPGATHSFPDVRNLMIDAVFFGADLFDTAEKEILRAMAKTAVLEEETASASDKTGVYFLQLSPEQQIQVDRSITQIRQDLRVGQVAWDCCARARLWCLLVQMAQWRAENPFRRSADAALELDEVLTFCAQHFHQSLSVEQLCALTFYSHSHFVRLFTREVGVPPSFYIRRLRLEHGQKLLRETRYPIADIARLSGFGDATAFGRAFKAAMGIKPLEYRRAMKCATQVKIAPANSL